MNKPQPATPPSDTDVEQTLYAKRQKVYPREVHGLFARLRVLSVLALLGIFYGLPWLTWEGQQAVLLDLPARKFHLFGITLWPQDFIYLTLLLLIAALSLFFFTAIAGRLWCGYACPQTVWTEVFLWMERKIEGDRPQQMKLDKSPLGWRKFRIKASKHTVWILFSLWTGFTFVGFFVPISDLGPRMLSFDLGPWETFWVLFYGFATYGNAGWLREQVCLYMCPYARFQSAMFDRNTLVISYDQERGEPRGSRKRSEDPRAKGLGDCIDCTMCVQVCPTGIDIRNGLQYECIGCSACIDACDDVMDKMGYPKGLIRYTTQNAMDGTPTRILRPRILVYATFLLVLLGGLGYSIMERTPLRFDVLPDRNTLYRETNEGLIENVYTLRIVNMDHRDHRFRLEASGIPGLTVSVDAETIDVEAGAVADLPVRLRADEMDLGERSTRVRFSLISLIDDKIRSEEDSRFLGPIPTR